MGTTRVLVRGQRDLATLAGLLIWIYKANVNSLIHLNVIGVFTYRTPRLTSGATGRRA